MTTETTSASPSPGPSTGPVNRHAPSAVEKQRMQLEKLLKDPAKPAYIPPPPKDKSIRPPREMMKNVQGSSAGAGSGEFHVYKASRRREYERLKLMEETTQKEAAEREFDEKKRKWEDEANAKTAKNRVKRQKKKEKGKGKSPAAEERNKVEVEAVPSKTIPLKKRRLVNGTEIVFRMPTDADEDDELAAPQEFNDDLATAVDLGNEVQPVGIADGAKIVIHDE